jgi:hypothetical protein
MHWKDILVGALVTLLVTIVAGIIVFYLTTPRRPSGEKLVYSLEQPFTYESPKTHDSFRTIKVANLGGQVSKDVTLIFTFGSGTKILDHAVNFSSGSGSAPVKDDSNDQQIILHLESLLPSENMAVSVMLSGVFVGKPTISVRSGGAMGELVESAEPVDLSEKNRKYQVIAYLLPILAVLQIVVALGLKGPLARLIRRRVPSERSLNNTAFLYLHTGSRSDAERILRRGIWREGGDAHMLANYALALALAGHTDQAQSQIQAAAIYAEQKHEKAVVEFNRALILAYTGNPEGAKIHIQNAMELSKVQILRYLGFSLVVKELRRVLPTFNSFLSDLGVSEI